MKDSAVNNLYMEGLKKQKSFKVTFILGIII